MTTGVGAMGVEAGSGVSSSEDTSDRLQANALSANRPNTIKIGACLRIDLGIPL
jgi:hypothetical protein